MADIIIGRFNCRNVDRLDFQRYQRKLDIRAWRCSGGSFSEFLCAREWLDDRMVTISVSGTVVYLL